MEYDSHLKAPTQEVSWADLRLSRALRVEMEKVGHMTPTPVQQRAIPIILRGRDVSVSAETGSGKTLAFLLPLIQRLLLRGPGNFPSAVLILEPTRELASQVLKVAHKVVAASPISLGLAIGGVSMKGQEAPLRAKPDIIIATPGRLLDHLKNTSGFDLSGLCALVLDEADRLLELGFKKELDELLALLPRRRQTVLLSATMTDKVSQIERLALVKPVRVEIDPPLTLPAGVRQEFVKLRGASREAAFCALLARSQFKSAIVFVATRAETHRLKRLAELVVWGWRGDDDDGPIVEMHGEITQAARSAALRRFSEQAASVLICTDVAARGLDIPDTEAVIQYTPPRQAATYIHRAGRTARAGRSGAAITLVSEDEWARANRFAKLGQGRAQARRIPRAVIEATAERIAALAAELEERLENDRFDAEARKVEVLIARAENIQKHQKEIFARPRKQWLAKKADAPRAPVQKGADAKSAKKFQAKRTRAGRKSERSQQLIRAARKAKRTEARKRLGLAKPAARAPRKGRR
eukprot:gnl/Chilomastix_cuspidata/1154.p2 GENE.gnl/Chilomastix_cuspidata/1154~~gnl/Chilomastix_cuspidata/1154.p2  ORF type:complete len:526 (+),score=297.08 gnl/Chilomastix_cuspidata/1154:47-1624(+)